MVKFFYEREILKKQKEIDRLIKKNNNLKDLLNKLISHQKDYENKIETLNDRISEYDELIFSLKNIQREYLLKNREIALMKNNIKKDFDLKISKIS